jgi:hypothetical protein
VADKQPITLREENDETLTLTIDRQQPADDLTTVATLELYLKTDSCQADDDPDVLLLSSSVPAEITITAQSAAQITAEAHIPAAALAGSYKRFWRVDGLTAGGERRTAMYGDVTVVNL